METLTCTHGLKRQETSRHPLASRLLQNKTRNDYESILFPDNILQASVNRNYHSPSRSIGQAREKVVMDATRSSG